MKRCYPRAAEFSKNIKTNYIAAMILLIRNGQGGMNGLYFMNIKYSKSLYQYQGARRTIRLKDNPSSGVRIKFQEMGGIVI